MHAAIGKAMDPPHGVPAVNELRGFVKKRVPAAIGHLSAEFPEFAEELTDGVVLGPEPGREDNRPFVERRAMLAVRLGREIVSIVTQRIEQVKREAASRRKRKITLLTLGGVSGAGTLGALGASPGFAARIGAAVTSLVAIGNAIHEFLLQQREGNLPNVVFELTKAQHALTVYCEELKDAVEEHIEVRELTELIDKANKIAEELSAKAAELGV